MEYHTLPPPIEHCIANSLTLTNIFLSNTTINILKLTLVSSAHHRNQSRDQPASDRHPNGLWLLSLNADINDGCLPVCHNFPFENLTALTALTPSLHSIWFGRK